MRLRDDLRNPPRPPSIVQRRDDEDVAVRRKLELRLSVDPEGFEQRLVDHEGEAVSGAGEAFGHLVDLAAPAGGSLVAQDAREREIGS